MARERVCREFMRKPYVGVEASSEFYLSSHLSQIRNLDRVREQASNT